MRAASRVQVKTVVDNRDQYGADRGGGRGGMDSSRGFCVEMGQRRKKREREKDERRRRAGDDDSGGRSSDSMGMVKRDGGEEKEWDQQR